MSHKSYKIKQCVSYEFPFINRIWSLSGARICDANKVLITSLSVVSDIRFGVSFCSSYFYDVEVYRINSLQLPKAHGCRDIWRAVHVITARNGSISR